MYVTIMTSDELVRGVENEEWKEAVKVQTRRLPPIDIVVHPGTDKEALAGVNFVGFGRELHVLPVRQLNADPTNPTRPSEHEAWLKGLLRVVCMEVRARSEFQSSQHTLVIVPNKLALRVLDEFARQAGHPDLTKGMVDFNGFAVVGFGAHDLQLVARQENRHN